MPDAVQPADVFFNRSCPVCGRLLRIRVHLLGQRVYCQHCGGGFTALDESLGARSPSDRVDDLIARAERALERSACGDSADDGFTG
ncbi:MAG: response regulator [Planctomycetaceae bacterium]